MFVFLRCFLKNEHVRQKNKSHIVTLMRILTLTSHCIIHKTKSQVEIKKHNIKSFGEEFRLSTKKSDAKKCVAFLLEWEDENIFNNIWLATARRFFITI